MNSVHRKSSLSVFFPCYNDSGTIQNLIEQTETLANEFTDDYEIIVIDDGSSDGSREILNHLQAKHPSLRPIFHGRNLGYGAALQTGFKQARKDWIFYTDGDGQYDVNELKTLLPLMTDPVDIVNGYKIKRSDPWYRHVLGTLYGRLAKIIFRIRIRDVNCDFRLIRRRVFDAVKLESTSGAIGLEFIKKAELAGFNIAECPVRHYRRSCGRSQFLNLRKIIQTGFDLIRLAQTLKES